jgi:hypothetical protein
LTPPENKAAGGTENLKQFWTGRLYVARFFSQGILLSKTNGLASPSSRVRETYSKQECLYY